MKLFFQIVLVAIGSALGGLARWGLATCAGRWFGVGFPWGTFIINITGCFFLGWFSTVLSDRLVMAEGSWIESDDLRLFIAVGFTGAFTTFSTFQYEAHGLVRDAEHLKAMTYLFGSLFLGLVSVRLGIMLANWR